MSEEELGRTLGSLAQISVVEGARKRSQKPLGQATRVMNRSPAFWGVS